MTAFAGMAGLPDYGDWVACDLVVGGDDEGVVGDGLGDDDAVESRDPTRRRVHVASAVYGSFGLYPNTRWTKSRASRRSASSSHSSMMPW